MKKESYFIHGVRNKSELGELMYNGDGQQAFTGT